MLARARSRLGPKLRAHACACSYPLSARDFGARPIPKSHNGFERDLELHKHMEVLHKESQMVKLQAIKIDQSFL